MFTGMIEEMGRVRSCKVIGGNLQIEIGSPKIPARLDVGSSVAVNGACLTVVSKRYKSFTVQATKETTSRTSLGLLRASQTVNLETPLRAGDMLHGHLVQGHVDCVAKIVGIRPAIGSLIFSFDYPEQFSSYLVEKGSVAVDGVSLTVTDASDSRFRVSIIPRTLENTVFKFRKLGDLVNIEFDIIAKYLQKTVLSSKKRITPYFLREHGF